MRKIIGKFAAAMVVGLGLLLVNASDVQAANKGKALGKNHGKMVITGKVLDSRGQPVAGAKVHIKHHRHKHHAKAANANAGVQKAAKKHKGHHHVVRTKADGSFTLHVKKAGNHRVVANKKGVGRGRAKSNGGAVTIHLHKHHKGHKGHAKTK